MKKALALGVLTLLVARAASAQSAYVAADVGADISRVSHSDTVFTGGSGGAQVFSWDLRVGTLIGSAWGVELGYVRSLSDRSNQPFAVPLAALAPNIVLPANFSITASHARSSFDAVAFARQHARAVDLVYLGGLSFLRDRTDVTTNFGGPASAGSDLQFTGGAAYSILIPASASAIAIPSIPIRIGGSTTTYSTHPLVGMEARIAMGGHARLTPGIRLQGISQGWLFRPYVGVGWQF